MPPLKSFTYRVNFYYTMDTTQDAFWTDEGMAWAGGVDSFIASANKMTDVVKSLTAAGDSDTVKLQKIYAAIMTMGNTRFSRQHDNSEDRAAGLKEIQTTQDIWNRKSGTDDELTDLFVTLARAAGMKAYVMKVTSRESNIFSPTWLSMDQLDDNVAIVVLDGKEQFFDPGQRYCPFGQLAWIHTGVQGVRETEDGKTAIALTPFPSYMQSQTQRIGDLTIDAAGVVSGTVKITWLGSPALEWRQQMLHEDEESMKHSMIEWIGERIPAGLEPEITSVENLDDYEKPLVANFTVHGPLATVTAKRLILPGEFFEASSKALFSAPTRTTSIYFHYALRTVDAVRIKFPPELQVESVPMYDTFMMQNEAAYRDSSQVQDNAVLIRRTYDLGTFIFSPKEYGDVKAFYDKMSTDDQQPLILLKTDAATSPPTETGNGHDKSN
ncbi:MAG TPA: hypothetical protein VNU94_06600 [Acidobacteriaceae bacterium]|jgi:hypothetical protein|nr:hypothetical protein [Acidobacteriaceae bacterium]